MAPNILMVFPRFNPNSFWSLQAACDIYGARCTAPPLGLMTLAAMLPRDWNIRLVNRNAEELADADLDWADMVMTGGMLPQQLDALAVMELCRSRGLPVVVGGPDPMSSPEIYAAADFLVLGEAEGIIDQFIAAWRRGDRSGRFEGEKFQVDVTKSPVPRFDLINFKHYLYIGVQFSRGCPFNCEFCDIIELYGRVPRAKTNEQMLNELEALYIAGYRGHVDFVDDNLIGNKKALKRFLPALKEWQERHRYPFEFSTEASMNLADDAQLLRMMREANFYFIFMGIESPDTDTLISTQKKQNTRRSLAESVHTIYRAGMVVIAGFIVGFDTEKSAVADEMIACIEATSIPMCMVGLLTALPNTQLTRRLEREGRLRPIAKDLVDQCTDGLNFETLRPRRDILVDYKTVLEKIYAPEAYFERARTMGRMLDRPFFRWPTLAGWIAGLKVLGRLSWRMGVRSRELRGLYWRTMFDVARYRLGSLEHVGLALVLYLHLGPFSRFVIAELDRQIADVDRAEPIARLPAHADGIMIPSRLSA